MLRSVAAIGLSLLLLGSPAGAVPTGEQSAGEVKALVPAASRNSHPLAVKDSLRWNDLLETNPKGRIRATLNDGSILSVGSSSQLRVVQHDAATQQTSIDLNYGKLRNQVVKITQPGGKYEVKTPNAVIGVIGTDFYVAYDDQKQRTTVICYAGSLSVVPGDGFAVVSSNNATAGAANAVTVLAGQIVVIGPKGEVGASDVLPPAAVVAMINAANVDTHVAAGRRTRLQVLIGMAVVAGLTIGLTQINSSSKPCGCK